MTKSSSNPAQRRFLLALLAFWTSVLLLLLLEELVFYRIGEIWKISRVSETQASRPDSLFLRRLFDQQFYLYKFNEIQRRRPEVLALGSSRVMQFRAQMFGEDSKVFYDAGGIVQCIEDLTLVLHQMPELKPRVVILGVDMWWFNADWDRANEGDADRGSIQPTDA